MQVASAAATASGLDELLERTSEAAQGAMGAASLSISKWERERSVMRTLINVGDLGPGEERWPEDETYGLDEPPQRRPAAAHRAALLQRRRRPRADPRAVALLRSLRKESDIGVPIVVEGEVWGEVWATTAPGSPRFTGRDVRFLEAIAGQLGGVVARGEMFSRVSRLAYEDELTGPVQPPCPGRAAGRRAGRLARGRTAAGAAGLRRRRAQDHQRRARPPRRRPRAAARGPGAGQGRGLGARRVRGAHVGRRVRRGHGGRRAWPRPAAWPPPRCGSCARSATPRCRCPAAWPRPGPGTERPESLMRAADAAQYAAKRRGGAQVCSAGRDDFHELLSAGEGATQRRRGRRRSQAERTEEACGRVLDLLDGSLAQRATLDRLEAVSSTLAQVVNAAGLDHLLRPARRRHDPLAGRRRRPRLAAARHARGPGGRGVRAVGLPGHRRAWWPRAAAPSTWTATTARPTAPSAACWTRSATPPCWPPRPPTPRAAYLLELYADGDTRELTGLTVSLSLLVRAAAANSASAMARVRAPAPPHPPHHRDQRRRAAGWRGRRARWTPPRRWSRSCTPPTAGR